MSSPTEVYQAITVRKGLELYSKHGIKPNSAWTPAAMMRTASNITGKEFKPRAYKTAIEALTKWIDERRDPPGSEIKEPTP